MSLPTRLAERRLRPFMGLRRWQRVWEFIERMSLQGLHVGSGAEVSTSGECEFLAAFVAAQHSSQRDIICLDVGANHGAWSETLLEYARSAALPLTIIAFEPSTAARSALNKRLNGWGGLTVEAFALGSQSKPGVLLTDAEGSGLASLYARRLDHLGISMNITEDVEVTTLDKYCQAHSLTHIDLLKLDVEGAEFDVLRGAGALLEAGSIGVIQWEFGGCNIDSRTFLQDFWYLLHDRFDLYRMLLDGLWPIESYQECHERFVTTNFVAIKRVGEKAD